LGKEQESKTNRFQEGNELIGAGQSKRVEASPYVANRELKVGDDGRHLTC
jgi:hypothetical protein